MFHYLSSHIEIIYGTWKLEKPDKNYKFTLQPLEIKKIIDSQVGSS